MFRRALAIFRRYRLYVYRRFVVKTKFTTADDPVKVLFADKDFLVIDKHFGVAVQKSSSRGYVLLYDQLSKSGLGNLVHCHRIDAVTSGCLLLAKTPIALLTAKEMFRKRKTIKLYLALIRGHLDDRIEINKPIGRSSKLDSRLQSCSDDAVEAKSARTSVIPLAFGEYGGLATTKVLVRIFTGRTHQIRVHLSDAGHHVVGDFIYSNRQDYKTPRVMLHSYERF